MHNVISKYSLANPLLKHTMFDELLVKEAAKTKKNPKCGKRRYAYNTVSRRQEQNPIMNFAVPFLKMLCMLWRAQFL